MAKKPSTHEDFHRHDDARPGSDRAFGFVFAAFCAIVGGTQWWLGHAAFPWWLIAAGLFAGAALLAPRVLHPLNVVWFRLGMVLHHIVTPVILGLMFYAVFTPMGVLMRLLGKRPLNLRFDPRAGSYWIPRDPPGPAPGSFPNQF